MAMRKSALIRMFAQHVTAFDLESLTNSKGHEERSSEVQEFEESRRPRAMVHVDSILQSEGTFCLKFVVRPKLNS